MLFIPRLSEVFINSIDVGSVDRTAGGEFVKLYWPSNSINLKNKHKKREGVNDNRFRKSNRIGVV